MKNSTAISPPTAKVISDGSKLKSLIDWRGSITIFQGFTGTSPVLELKDAVWDEIRDVLRPSKPVPLSDKRSGQYFVPCSLKEAPLVGKTLEASRLRGEPITGKMRSKGHVTEAAMLVMDIDGLPTAEFMTGLERIKSDGLTLLAYTTHSHGRAEKLGVHARIVTPLDRPATTEEYKAAWHGFDNRYFSGAVSKTDSSGAKMYQQQGTWCCDPSRIGLAESWNHDGGVASIDKLIELGRVDEVPQITPEEIPSHQETDLGTQKTYPPSDANKVADTCKQIGDFRNTKGAGQSEPLWFDCLGVVGHCTDGDSLCQEWSSGFEGYDKAETAKKITARIKTPPTTCKQFRKTNPKGCSECTQACNSPITLGWAVETEVEATANTASAGDPATAVRQNDAEVIARLAAMSPLEYDRVRADQAKLLGCRTAVLDEMVKAARNVPCEDSSLPFPEVEQHPESIDPAQLLDEIVVVIRRYIVLDVQLAIAAALWVALTWFADVVSIATLAIINAPEKACAKTLLQTLLAHMAYRPLSAANATTSVLFRSAELWRPTIFIDEADTFFRANSELNGMVNAGYHRDGFVLRSEAVGDSFIPRKYSVYCPKSIAGISLEKHLTDATMSRGIVLNLRRKLPHETVERFRHADKKIFEDISSKLARFAADYSQQVRQARPTLPEALSDRAQDNWEPLLAIAGCAGTEWVQRATEVALKLSGPNEESVSTGNELLADIQRIFESKKEKGVTKISTRDLISELIADDELPWATYNRGKPISPRQLSKQLSFYGIKSKTVRFGVSTPKGYEYSQFVDAFARYLTPPENLPQPGIVLPKSNTGKAPHVSDTGNVAETETTYATPNPLLPIDCGGVSEESPTPGDATEKQLEDLF